MSHQNFIFSYLIKQIKSHEVLEEFRSDLNFPDQCVMASLYGSCFSTTHRQASAKQNRESTEGYSKSIVR